MNNDFLNILLAENSESNRLFFGKAIKEARIKTVIDFAHDDIQLLDYLNKIRYNFPQVIFLDINLPLSGGMDCLMEIRANNRLKDVAVAIYSSACSDEIIEDAFVKGANIFIVRPYDPDVLGNILSYVLNMYWNYYSSGLRMELFMLNVNGYKKNGY